MPTDRSAGGVSSARGVAAARRLLKPAVRRAERRFLVEGPQAVRAAAAAGVLLEVFATAGAAERLPRPGVTITVVGDRALATLADTVMPQGVVGVAASLDVSLEVALAGDPRLVAVLLDARDPGNVGTIVRTADAAGADAVLLADGDEGGSVDVHNGKCVRASAGSVFHLPLAAAPWPDVLDALRHARLRILATTGTGDVLLDDLTGLDRPTAWVLGNEAHGLPPSVVDACDAGVRIPIHGRAESLNVASAAAVCLYASAGAHSRRERS